jgi:hypothetical protein
MAPVASHYHSPLSKLRHWLPRFTPSHAFSYDKWSRLPFMDRDDTPSYNSHNRTHLDPDELG